MHEDTRSPEHGPWTAELSPDGRLVLSSDDFNHDAQLLATGDFASPTERLAYGRHLAELLTRGAQRTRATQELGDTGGLLNRLEQAAHGPHGELLELAADEIAKLRVALAEANDTLKRLEAHRYFTRKTTEALSPSAFAQALRQALEKG